MKLINPLPSFFESIHSPCYCLDQNLLEKNLAKIKQLAQQSGAEFILALKGFSMWSAFPLFNQYGFDKATASSLWEARLAVEEMGSLAHSYAPVYTNEDFDEIAGMSSHLSFNSFSQYQKYRFRAHEANSEISLGLRINPEFSQVETQIYNPCAQGSRLGVCLTSLPSYDHFPKDIKGFHCHALCESSAEDFEKLLAHFEERFGAYFAGLEWINFGGGHLVTRKDYNTELLIKTLISFKKRYPHLHLILEPGSAFAWETGYLVSTIEDIVENQGIKTAILNVSFSAHMPDCLEMPYFPKVFCGNKSQAYHDQESHIPNEHKFSYRLGGNTCLAGDFMESWHFDHELKIGERLIFNDMIHYTMVKTTLFNGVKHPAICIYKDKQILYKRNFIYSDFKSRLS